MSLLSKEKIDVDIENEKNKIRPQTLNDYLGQEDIKKQLDIYIKASKMRGEPLDHTLLFGPPGLGKTTLSHIIAHEMGSNLIETSGPVLEKAADLAMLLVTLKKGDVLFIDEIHRLHPSVEEILYPAMEDFKIDLLVGEGMERKSIQIEIPPFTLVGATTKSGMLSAPLRDRFGIIQRLQFYNDDELRQIVQRSARILNVDIDSISALEIAKRSRGTPRIANRLLRRSRDVAQVRAGGVLSSDIVDNALQMLGVDKLGLDNTDQRYLSFIIDNFKGGPVGLGTLASSLSEESQTIEDVIEPYLLQQGYIARTNRGRIATDLAYEHLGKTKEE